MSKLYLLESGDDIQELNKVDGVSREDDISPDRVHLPGMQVERRDGRKRLREPALFPVWAIDFCLAFPVSSPKRNELESLFADAGMTVIDCVTTDGIDFRVGFVTASVDLAPGTLYDERLTPPSYAPHMRSPKWAVVSRASANGVLAFKYKDNPRRYVYFTQEFVERLEALGCSTVGLL